MKTTMTRVLGMLLALTIAIPAVASAQERVGVATTVVGPVTITHEATSPAPLKFKDDVLLNDRVTTVTRGSRGCCSGARRSSPRVSAR